MLKLLLLPLAAAGGCAPAACQPASPGPRPTVACQPGVEIVIEWDQPAPCDLDGSQTLVLLGGTEAHCESVGGRWVYEACEDVDY